MLTNLKKRAFTVMLALAMVMTFMPLMSQSVYAVSAPAKVKSLKATLSGTNASLSWSKASGAKGYAVYRNGKVITKTTKLKYTDKGLAEGASYKYSVKAYATYKQYYNSKTKKWVNKKPAKKYWKGKKTRTKYKYGKVSPTRTVKTAAKPDPQSVLKIGGSGPLTGPAAFTGEAVNNGAKLAAAEINAANPGGIQIEWSMLDDAHNAEKAVANFNSLKNQGMKAFIGTVTASPCIAVAEHAYSDRVFMMTPTASSPEIPEGKDNVYQFCLEDSAQGAMAAEYIARNNPSAVVGAFYNSGDSYSSSNYQAFKAKCDESGIAVTAVTLPDSSSEYTTQLNTLKQAGVDTLFMPLYYFYAADIITKAHEIGFAPTIIGIDGMDGILELDGFDTSLAEGMLMVVPFTPNSERADAKAFVESYKAKYGSAPTSFAAAGYDSVKVIYNAFVLSGSKPTDSVEDICAAMMGVFNSGSFVYNGISGSNMKWDVTGKVSKDPTMIVIRGGQYQEAD